VKIVTYIACRSIPKIERIQILHYGVIQVKNSKVRKRSEYLSSTNIIAFLTDTVLAIDSMNKNGTDIIVSGGGVQDRTVKLWASQ
jgi:predicted polyphosphate/ATP-dependent NAD kinase